MAKQETRKWNSNLPLSILPEKIRNIFIEYARFMYEDLRVNKQEVKLKPAPYPYEDRNKIRVVKNQPPEWYSELYGGLGKNRGKTFDALKRIINSEDRKFEGKMHMCRYVKGYKKTEKGIAPTKRFKHFYRVRYGRYKRDSILRNLIFECLTRGYECQGELISLNNKVRKYFGLEEMLLNR